MTLLDERVAQLCAGPAGCAFLLTIEQSDIAPDAAVTPEVAHTAASHAVGSVSRWNADHDEIVTYALSQGPRLEAVASSLLSQPGAEWWFAPLPRRSQLWAGRKGKLLDLATLVTPTEPPTGWERYAQKPAVGLYTSTVTGELSSSLIAAGEHAGDYLLEPPYTRYLLHASQATRVYEVTGPATWHAICVAYPAHDDDGKLVPDWSGVARDWDAVHLTLGGLLTAEQVRVEDAAGWSRHDSWDFEQTVWLRNRFVRVERWPDLSYVPASDVEIGGWT